MRFVRRLTSAQSCSTSCRAGAEMPAIEGGAASMMRSANRANSSSGVESGEEASTARTFAIMRRRYLSYCSLAVAASFVTAAKAFCRPVLRMLAAVVAIVLRRSPCAGRVFREGGRMDETRAGVE